MQLRVFLALIPLALALASPACAQQVADGGTLDRILPDIRAAHPGRLSDAEPWIDENGRTHYRIKWMTPEGRILYFDADARTGRYSSTGGERDGGARPADRTQSEGPDNRPSTDDRGRNHDNLNGEPNPYGGDGGPRRGGGDAQGGDVPRDQGRGGDRRGGDWRNNGDRRGNGDWRGGRDAGDNGGGRHHGHGGF